MQSEQQKTRIKKLKFLVASFSFAFCIFNFTFIYAQQPVSSIDLISNAKDLDGKTIIFEGEAIGNLMNRGNFAWLNITESGNAIGVWLPKILASKIKFTGGYSIRGDLVRVEGIFNRACIEHGGDLDIHAAKLIILNYGERQKDLLPDGKKRLAIYLGGICLCLLIYQLYRQRQKNRSKTA